MKSLKNKRVIFTQLISYSLLVVLFFTACKQNDEPEIIVYQRPLLDSILKIHYFPEANSRDTAIYKYFFADNQLTKITCPRSIRLWLGGANWAFISEYQYSYSNDRVTIEAKDSSGVILAEYLFKLNDMGFADSAVFTNFNYHAFDTDVNYTHDSNGFITKYGTTVIDENIFRTDANDNIQEQYNIQYRDEVASFHQYNGVYSPNNPIFFYADFIGRPSKKLINNFEGQNWSEYTYVFDSSSRVKSMKYCGHFCDWDDTYVFYYK